MKTRFGRGAKAPPTLLLYFFPTRLSRMFCPARKRLDAILKRSSTTETLTFDCERWPVKRTSAPAAGITKAGETASTEIRHKNNGSDSAQSVSPASK